MIMSCQLQAKIRAYPRRFASRDGEWLLHYFVSLWYSMKARSRSWRSQS
jgi:hypothetical protein